MHDRKKTTALSFHFSVCLLLLKTLQYKNEGMMKLMVFEPKVPTNAKTMPTSSTNTATSKLVTRMHAVIRCCNVAFSLKAASPFAAEINTMMLFLHGNSCRGNVHISATAIEKLPMIMAAFFDNAGLEFMESKKLDLMDDP